MKFVVRFISLSTSFCFFLLLSFHSSCNFRNQTWNSVRQLIEYGRVFKVRFQLADSKGLCTKVTAIFLWSKNRKARAKERKINIGGKKPQDRICSRAITFEFYCFTCINKQWYASAGAYLYILLMFLFFLFCYTPSELITSKVSTIHEQAK